MATRALREGAISPQRHTHAPRAAPRDGSRHQRRVPPAHRHAPPLHTASFCLGKWLRPRQKRSNQPPGASVSAPPSGTGRLSVEKIPGGLWLCLCLGGREESASGGKGAGHCTSRVSCLSIVWRKQRTVRRDVQ